MSATEQKAPVPTVLAERNQDGSTNYMPNLELFNPFYIKTGAGTFTSSSLAALAFDLLSCKKALEKKASLRELQLHHALAWLEAQPLFLPLLEGSFEDLCKTLRNDPSILQTAFPRTRGPQGTLKMKMEMLQSLSSESSQPSEDNSEPSPPVQGLVVSPEIIDLASPGDNEIQPHHPDSRSPPLSSGNKVVRTNWANFPLNTSSQSVLLTKFQVSSGAVSVPLGRAHSVLGAFSKSCTVTLKAPSSSFLQDTTAWKCGYNLYASQPTQVFLTKLKAFFTASGAKAGDVLTLSEISPGICNAHIWHASSPQATEFKSMLANGWSDISPPLKNPISPDTGEKKKKKTRQQETEVIDLAEEKDFYEEDNKNEEEDDEESPPGEAVTTARRLRTRPAPRRYIIYSSGESQDGDYDDEEYFKQPPVASKSAAGGAGAGKKRKRVGGGGGGRPKKGEQQQQQQQQQPADFNAQTNQNASRYSQLALQHQHPITKYTAAANPSPSGVTPAPRLRRSPAKKPRKAAPVINLTTEGGLDSLYINSTAGGAGDGGSTSPIAASGLIETAALRRQKKSHRAASRSVSPHEARTKRHDRNKAATETTPRRGLAPNSSSSGGGGGGGGVRRVGGGRYSSRSEAAYLQMRRERRKGIPRRAAEGDPNLQVYYDALMLVDLMFTKGCTTSSTSF